MRRFFMLGIMLLAGATGPRAEDKPGDWLNPYHLEDTIVVTANRLATPVSQTASSVTVITAREIQQSQAANLAEALRAVPGLNVVQSGGPGQQTSLFLRGANAEHVLVLIDGVKINDPSSPNNATNLANLGVANIDRIEILRGPQSVLYGSDAVGGIIQIFTKQGTGRPEVNLSAEGGSLNTYCGQLAVRAGTEKHDYSVSISRRSTDGISAAAVGNRAERDGFNNTIFSAAAGLRPSSKIQLRLTGQASESHVDLDQGYGVLEDSNYTMKSKEQFASARLDHEIARGLWWQQFGAYVTHYERRTIDGTDSAHPYDTSNTHYEGLRIKYDWQLAAALRESLRMTVGAEIESDHLNQRLFYLPVWFGDPLSELGVVKSRTSGMYAMGELGREGLGAITAGGRWDHHDQFGDHGTYRLTGVYHLLRLKLRATYGTGFKSPSLYQIYDPATGNPRLQPERSRGGEIGLESTLGRERLTVGATYFDTHFDNLIRFQVEDTLTFAGRMFNVAEATTSGVETYVDYVFGASRFHLDYTYTRAIDRSTDLDLLRRPRQKASVVAERQISQAWFLRAEATYTGQRDDIGGPKGRVTLHDYTLMNMAGSYTLRGGLRLSARIDNLFNTDYQEVWLFENMPRTVTVRVDATF